MKKTFIIICLALLPAFLFAQDNVEGKQRRCNARVNIRGSVGALFSLDYDAGASESFSAFVESNISRRYSGWNINYGFRLTNRNIMATSYRSGVDKEEYTSDFSSLFFFEIPVLFSYDFEFGDNRALRLEFGPYYSRYIGGVERIYAYTSTDKSTAAFSFKQPKTLYVNNNNVGFTAGVSYYINDVIVGLNYDCLILDDFQSAVTGTVGYRF